jgi:hypothetical protein
LKDSAEKRTDKFLESSAMLEHIPRSDMDIINDLKDVKALVVRIENDKEEYNPGRRVSTTQSKTD